MPQELPAAARIPAFATRAALFAWLEQEQLAHVARFGLEVVAPWIPPELWPQLRAVGARRRLVDCASTDQLARTADWVMPPRLRELLPEAAARVIAEERAQAAAARASIAERLLPPDGLQTAAVHQQLLALRARIPATVAPRPQAALREEKLAFDPELPGFRLGDPRPFEAQLHRGGGMVRPEARLTLTPGAEALDCDCGARDCIHLLAAIDAARLWLHQPPSEAFNRALAELERPRWARPLLALDRTIEDGASPAALEVSWRLHVVEGAGVQVQPWLLKPARRGQRRTASVCAPRRLRLEHGAKLPPVDARISELLPDDLDALASRALLEALVDHPRLALVDAPEQQVRIDRAQVGLVGEERGGAVRVGAGVEGAALPPELAERVRRGKPEEALFLWDRGARRLTLLDCKPELRAMLHVLAREGDLFPEEGRAALVASLSKWAQRVPVAMPRSVMGERVPPRNAAVLRLAAQASGAVEVAVRLRALPGAPALEPGEGPRDVHARQAEKTFHAVRDLAAERALAAALVRSLGLGRAEPTDLAFTFRYPDAQGALELLERAAQHAPPPELEWVGVPLRVSARASVGNLRLTLEKKREWFGLLGGLSVGGERVELARLIEAARRKERYVRASPHSYLELDALLRAHLEQLAEHAAGSEGPLGVGLAAADALRDLRRAGAEVDGDASWRALVERMARASERVPEVPSGLGLALRPYQVEGFRWMARLASWGVGGVLADDMGLGKTAQALALLVERAAEGPALVVAPTSVAFNWREEAARFAPSLRVHDLAEADDRAGLLARLGANDVLLVGYGLLVSELHGLAARHFATAIFDEAQNLKNPATQRARAARALHADARFALSGTPIENHLGELWSLFAVACPGALPGWEEFRGRYAIPIERGVDPAAAPALARAIRPFLLRRTKAEVERDLPPRTDVQVRVVLSPAEWHLYEDARLAALSDLESPRRVMREQNRRVEVLAALTRLRLLASHPRLQDPRSQVASSKLARALELIEELREEGQRALVFSQFTGHLALVREALEARGIGYVYLDGQTPKRQREARVREFQGGDAPVFLLSLKAAGAGLNLTAATNVILLDPWWNPAVEQQAADRAHRPGQIAKVAVYRLIAVGTVEELMLALHEDKRALVERVLEGEQPASALSSGELMELLASSAPPRDD